MNAGIICCFLNESVLHICFKRFENWTFKSLSLPNIFETKIRKIDFFSKLEPYMTYIPQKKDNFM